MRPKWPFLVPGDLAKPTDNTLLVAAEIINSLASKKTNSRQQITFWYHDGVHHIQMFGPDGSPGMKITVKVEVS